MEEKTEANENFIKVLNKEKVSEFKLNQKSSDGQNLFEYKKI